MSAESGRFDSPASRRESGGKCVVQIFSVNPKTSLMECDKFVEVGKLNKISLTNLGYFITNAIPNPAFLNLSEKTNLRKMKEWHSLASHYLA
jgi:hypothetical protein